MTSLRTRALQLVRIAVPPSLLSGGVCAAGLALLIWRLNPELANLRAITIIASWIWLIYAVLFGALTAVYLVVAHRFAWPAGFRDVVSLHLAGGFFLVFFEMLEPSHQPISTNPHLTLLGVLDLAVLVSLSGAIFVIARRKRTGRLAVWLTPAAVAAACAVTWSLAITQEPDRSRTAALADVEAALADHGPRPSTAAERTSGQRVLLIAIDGADWATVATLIREGRLPAFETLLRGSDYYEMDNLGYAYSAPIWASLYTGIESPASGVYDFVRCRFPGVDRPILQWPRWRSLHTLLLAEEIATRIADFGAWTCQPADSRDIVPPPLWSIAAARGRRTLVVNPLPFSSIPENLAGGAFVSLGEDQYLAFEGRVPRKVGPKFKAGPSRVENVTARERAQSAATVELMKGRSFDLVIYYTHFLDAIQHYNHREVVAGRGNAPDASAAAPLARSGIAAAYMEADRSMAELMEAFGDGTVIMVSDHGWSYHGDYEHFHSPMGMLVVSPAMSKGPRGKASVLNVAPSVLTLLSIPATAEMASVLDGIAERPRIESFAGIVKREYLISDRPEMDPERMRWLRSLGYLW